MSRRVCVRSAYPTQETCAGVVLIAEQNKNKKRERKKNRRTPPGMGHKQADKCRNTYDTTNITMYNTSTTSGTTNCSHISCLCVSVCTAFFMLPLRCVLYCCGACCFKSQCFLQLSDTCSAFKEIEISTTTTTNPHGREGRRRQADNGFSLLSFPVSGHYRLTDDWNHQQTNFFLGTSFLLPVPDSLSSSLLFFLFVFSSFVILLFLFSLHIAWCAG